VNFHSDHNSSRHVDCGVVRNLQDCTPYLELLIWAQLLTLPGRSQYHNIIYLKSPIIDVLGLLISSCRTKF